MTRLAFDIEGDNLLDDITTIHCICIKDIDTGETFTARSDVKGSICRAIEKLEAADEIWAHNGTKFDVPAVAKLHGFRPRRVRDTLVCLRLIWPDLMDIDTKLVKQGRLPQNLMKSHSLEAWGHRIGEHKGSFGKGDPDCWQYLTDEMVSYCEQDVEVLVKLVEIIDKKEYSQQSIDLEHLFAELMFLQEQNGFGIDLDKAHALHRDLMARYQEIQDELQEAFPPRKQTMKTPQYWIAWDGDHQVQFPTKGAAQRKGYKEIEPGPMKVKEIFFNPGSRPECADRLRQKYAWKPPEQLSDDVFDGLPYPEAKLIAEYLMVKKRLGQLSEGKAAWLKLEKNGKIHGSINTNGAVTGRCTHSRPNMAQVPKASDKVPFGERCRELFGPTRPGWKLVGCDASGLELRCLAHYMARWDDGAYADEILNGDVHTTNQQAAGLETRDQAKTFIYAFIYGAGDGKLGSIKGKGAKVGKALRAQFLSDLPALGNLIRAVKSKVATTKSLNGIDGRVLHVRSQHSCLNTLLQSAGAVVMKQALVEFVRILTEDHGLVIGEDFALCANVHDEFQVECKPEHVDLLLTAGPQAIKRAGEILGFRCPLDGEARVGENWKETH